MAVQTNTRKADKIVAGQTLLKDIEDKFPLENSELLFSMIKKLENKISDIYSGTYGKFPKIETKPFYYFVAGNYYIVDPQRFFVANTGNVPTTVEGVPTTYFNYDRLNILAQNYSGFPAIFQGNDNNMQIKNKDNSMWVWILYYNNYYREGIIKNNGSIHIYGNTCNSQSEAWSDALRLPLSTSTGFQNALKYNLMPSDLTSNEKKLFTLLVKYQSNGWLVWNGN